MQFSINPNAIKSDSKMLFVWIEKQIQSFLEEKNLNRCDLINLGIGDTCHNLPLLIKDAIIDATVEMSKKPIGYGDESGYFFLKKSIQENISYYNQFSKDEIFITEGIANSLSLLLDIFNKGAKIGVLSPSYPVYSSLLDHLGMEKVFIKENRDHSFSLPKTKLDGIILCSPNNPTSLAFSKIELQKWVDWAIKTNCIILFDAAYSSFIFNKKYPSSIYEIEGAKKIAIEMKSFSKSHGFSGLRLGYFIFPKEICYKNQSLLPYCKKMIAAKTNGVSYPIQKAGLAALSKEGMLISSKLCKKYLERTNQLKYHLITEGKDVLGGICAPYLFLKSPCCCKKMFQKLLYEKNIITIPGSGFGADGFLRLSGFITEKTLQLALKNLSI